ncbi:MAG: glycosyltransferase, partial [Candidatus Cloacimonetes bacterium]|nr:glycosyltransferase [Candidatus Cloacimonadota bacterium]
KVNGIETFVKSANFLPEATFLLIGPQLDDSIDYLKSIAPSNVIFKGYTPPDELSTHFGHAKVYAQLSAQESFGCALAEAMLCECVPVVTDRGAIPEVVGNTGYYVPYDDPEATAEAIKEALNSDKGTETRQRILDNYSLKKRENFLIQEIKKLI